MNTFNKNDYRSGFRERIPVHYIFLSVLMFRFLCMANISMAMQGVVLNIYDLKGLNVNQFSQARLTHSFEITPSTQGTEGGTLRTTYSIQQRPLITLTERHPVHPKAPEGSKTPHISTLTLKTAVSKEGTPPPKTTKHKMWPFRKKDAPPQSTDSAGASGKIYTCTRTLRNPPQIFTMSQIATQPFTIAFDHLQDSSYYITIENMPNFDLSPTSLNFKLPPDSLIYNWSNAEEQFGLFNMTSDRTNPRLTWSSQEDILAKLLPLNERWSGNLLDIVLGIDCRWEIRAVLMRNPDNADKAILLGLQLTLPDHAAALSSLTPHSPPTPLQNLFVQLQPLDLTEGQQLISQLLLTNTPIEPEQTESSSPFSVPLLQESLHQPESGSSGSNHDDPASLMAFAGQLSLDEPQANFPSGSSSSPSVDNGSGFLSRVSLRSSRVTDYENTRLRTSTRDDDYVIMRRSSSSSNDPGSRAFTFALHQPNFHPGNIPPVPHSWEGTAPPQSQSLSPNNGFSPHFSPVSPISSGHSIPMSQYDTNQHTHHSSSSVSRGTRACSKSTSHSATSPIVIPLNRHHRYPSQSHQHPLDSPNSLTTGSTPASSCLSEEQLFPNSPLPGSASGTHSPISPRPHVTTGHQNSPHDHDEIASALPQPPLDTIYENWGPHIYNSPTATRMVNSPTSRRQNDYVNVNIPMSCPTRPLKPEPLPSLPFPLPQASKEDWQEYHDTKKRNEELYRQMFETFERDMAIYRQKLEIFKRGAVKPTQDNIQNWHDPDNDGSGGASGGHMLIGRGFDGTSVFHSY